MKSTQFTFRTIFLLFLENMKNYEIETEWKRRTRACHHRPARPSLGPRRLMVWPPRRPFPTLVRSGAFLLTRKILLYNPPDPWRSVYRFLDVFCFKLFLPGSVFGLEAPWPPTTRARGFWRKRRRCHQDKSSKPEEASKSWWDLLTLDVLFLITCRDLYHPLLASTLSP